MNLPIVVREEVWKTLKSSDSNFAEAVRQCIDKIEHRQFDFGLRVKKLKGISQIVWEARIDRSSRLLFTYRQSQDRQGQSRKFIAIEAVCVEHDRTIDRAKTIDRQWWEELAEIKVIGNLDREFDGLSTEEIAKIDDGEVVAEIESRSNSTDELLDNTKWSIVEPEILRSATDWQTAIQSGKGLKLRLSLEESETIDTYGNILISGSAGTGKTTVGLYRIARTLQMNPAAKCLYVSCNPILVKESRSQFQQLWRSNGDRLKQKIDFLTIRDLCLKITTDFGERFDRQISDYAHFQQRYLKKPESKYYPAYLVWDEIRSIIKGGNINDPSKSPLLTQTEYESLGKNRSGVIRPSERHKIYKLARWYQNYLDREKLVDEIDLTRSALHLNKIHEYHPYTLIVCDEVQDFTEIQIDLLIKLLSRDGKILCAGDTNQTIDPSGFRWEDLTTRLYRHNDRWTETKLSFNFRSTSRLASLADKVLNLKFQLLSESKFRADLPVEQAGELARLVTTSKDDLIRINLGANDAVLVRTDLRKLELMKVLNTKLILTIEEAKGLEFDTVYAIDFFEQHQKLWARALNSAKQLTEHQKPELRLEFNLLYVMITRARRLLNICEVEIADLWKLPDLAEHLIPMSASKAFDRAMAIDAQDWYQRAIYYRDARLFPQALECATKSGDRTLEREIEVVALLADRQDVAAASILLELNQYTAAAEIFERVESWHQAYAAWDLADNFFRKSACQIQDLLQKGERQAAAQLLISMEEYSDNLQIRDPIADWTAISERDDDRHSDRSVIQPTLCREQTAKLRKLLSNQHYVEAYIQRGIAKYNLGDKQGSIADFNRAIDLDPHSADACGHRALAKAQLGDRDGAIDDFDRVIAINPQSANAYYHRGMTQKCLEDKQAAIADFDRAIALDPDLVDAYGNRGIARLESGDKQGAVCDFDRVIALHPDAVDAYGHRGLAKAQLGDREGAIDDFDRIIELNPISVEAYSNRGVIKYDLGDKQGAIADYDRAIALDPNCAKAYNNRGNAKYNSDDKSGSITDYDRAISLCPNLPETYYNRGLAKQFFGDMPGAIADYDRAIALEPSYLNAYNNRGKVKGDLGDLKGAIADFNRAIAIDPQDIDAYYHRGRANYSLGAIQAAIADLDRVIALDPNSAKAYISRGMAKYCLGDKQGAISDYDLSIDLDPKCPEAYNNRGNAKYNSDDKQGAISDYYLALSLAPGMAETYYNLGLAKQYLGLDRDAIADYNRTIALNPTCFHAYFQRGKIKFQVGDKLGAVADYDRAISLQEGSTNDLNPQDAEAYKERALTKSSLGDSHGAIADYDRAITIFSQKGSANNSSMAIACHDRGVAKYNLGDLQGAIADYERSAELFQQQGQLDLANQIILTIQQLKR